MPPTGPGSVPATSGGLLMIVPAAYDCCVATEEVELERVGEEGLILGPRGAGGGDGATETFDDVRW